MEETRERVKNLKLSYQKQPQKELLIAMPNPYPDREYEEEIVTGEFTSLCPLNPGQPDYATFTIKYVPDRKILELKSLKFYLASYRMVETFYEEATNRILDDLVEAIKPRRMEIVADWNIRGGMDTRITVNYQKT
ncbi:MAG: NADPH-dependent 7-cyano-7-deazaguanine reductase QueF [Chloroflexi bacterium]|nr:NADPH-dependent 7-cyano-7-deazaguanine reductase QueF [Chloroflexota bacterium]MBM3172821.1 NADPH-dependent 7-cyano-7-deazaguanine reductase QueF [Chloroflexota bacterium]MBM3174866.1 NADPH-dependent 7-cyano-7-deazaguanine reductase QueF [Chloroflexota bacterium]MBM4450897.1 NADPH-dependent 7-cyano-7-deazaguanine reductase QueF [Chloroflexota bacterium]